MRHTSLLRWLPLRVLLRAVLLPALVLPVPGVPRVSALRAQDAEPGSSFDATAYHDDTARQLHQAARAAWIRVERQILSYTALMQERSALDLRLPIRDRALFRDQRAARIFWSRDGEVLVQMLGSREWNFVDDDDDEGHWRGGNIFDPGTDRLSFGMMGTRRGDTWFHHPLGRSGTEHYRFRTGDTLRLALPDGRELRAIELQMLPRAAHFRRIAGSLWIEPETGGLARALYRLSTPLDLEEQMREEGEDTGGLGLVPGLFRPLTFNLSAVAVEYTLWDFRVWLPRSMRMEGMFGAGIVKVPGAVEVSYRMESVLLEGDLAGEAAGAPSPVLEERHFRTRSEALAFLAELAGEAGIAYQVDESAGPRGSGGPVRRVRYLLPEDRSVLARSPQLPPPIHEDAPGFFSSDRLREHMERLARLPVPGGESIHWTFSWGMQRPDLVRYNRVEGASVGARAQLLLPVPGGLSLAATSFFGASDRSLKLRLMAERETVQRKLAGSVYRGLEPVSRAGRHLGLGNSLNAALFGRDDGEYFGVTGAEVRWTPPTARRPSWELRLYAERQRPLETRAGFSLRHVRDGAWSFRPNVEADSLREVGAALLLAPWWGSDPLAPQAGAELYAQGALGDFDYARWGLTLRGVLPLLQGRLRVGTEVGAGDGRGELPAQRHWFLGGPQTLRGYDASTLVGPSFARARLEVAGGARVGTLAVFGDGAWAGEGLSAFRSGDALLSVGAGISLLDGVIRLDAARGLREPRRKLRFDLYLDGIL